MARAELDLIINLKDNASSELRNVESSLGRVGGIAAGALVGGLAVAGVAVAGFAGSAIQGAADFESGMNRIASVAGGALEAAGISMDDVKQKALDLGAQTQFSAGQAQEAMLELAKGGIPVEDIMGKATDATLALAAAGEVELANSANIVAKQLGVWSAKGVEATDVANLMAQAANASTVGVEELAGGLANAQGTAAAMGVEYEDLVQTMALLAPNFASASTAGTSLNNFLVRLQPTTDPAIEAMEGLGLMTFNTTKGMQYLKAQGIDPTGMSVLDMKQKIFELGVQLGQTEEESANFVDSMDQSVFFDQAGAFVGNAEAARLLQEATEGLSEAEKTLALQTIFGNDGMGAAVALAEAGAEGYAAMGESMVQAGSAMDQAAQKQQGFTFALDSLKGSMETIMIIVGGALIPVLTDLINNVAIPAANAFMSFSNAVIAGQSPLDMLSQAVGTNVIPILAGLGAMILAAVIPPFWAWAAAAAASATATIVALAPVLLPIAAIGAAVALLFAAWDSNFMGIQDVTANIWAQVQPIFEQLQTWLATNIPAAAAAVVAFWTGTLQPALSAVWSFIEQNVIPILAALADVALAALEQQIQAASAAVTQIIIPALQSMWKWIEANVLPILQQLSGYIGDTIGPILSSFGSWLNDVTGGFEGISNAISGVIGWLRSAADAIRSLPDLPEGWMPHSPTPIEMGFRGIADAVSLARGEFGALKQEAGTLPTSVLSAVSPVIGAGPQLSSNVGRRGGGGGGGGAGGSIANAINIVVNAAPGQSEKTVAEKVGRELGRQTDLRRRIN